MFDWNDVKAFLAVARAGSTLAAAKTLKVNQTTVARRLESLEAALDLKLVERAQSGSRLTEAGQGLLAEAEKLERAAEGFGARAQAHQRGLAGVIRITATEILANAILTPAIAQFRRRYPEVQVELVSSDFPLDVDGGEVDVAMRSGRQLPASDLLARKVADWDFALFCSREYAERRGVPRSLAELKDHDLISVETPLGPGPGVAWMLQQAGGKAAAHTSNTMINLVSAVQAGLGIAPMPSLLMDPDPRMVRCSDDIASERVSSWIVTRRGRRDAARIAAFVDFIVPFVQQDVKARVARSRAVREGLTAGEAI